MFVTLIKPGKTPDVRAANPGDTVRGVLEASGMSADQIAGVSVKDSASGSDVGLDSTISNTTTLIVGQNVAGA